MEQSLGATSCPSDCTLDPNGNYKLLQSLGEGSFGKVVQCYKKDTNENVAVKIFKSGDDYHSELMTLNYIRRMDLERHNIVKFIESFTLMNDEVALAFEKLDITLLDYISIHRDFTPMELCDIRSVVQQLAIALDALKTARLIHTDIKVDNIMLVDRKAQPLRVKLIDFGLALPTSWAGQKTPVQTKHFRAPEIFLGLPFSEAIDMWSAGVVMAYMMLADVLFRGIDDYDAMRWIVAFRGVPPDHLLDAATKSQHYFIKEASGHWRLKTPVEYCQSTKVPRGYKPLYFDSMDILEDFPLENLEMVGADERREFIDLLKSMLEMDPSDRITPSQVLTHPFITRGTVHKTSDTSESPETPSVSPGVIHVQPTSRTCSLTSEGEVKPKTSSSAPDGLLSSTLETLSPGVILVMPSSPERHLGGIEGSRQSESRPLDFLDNGSENPPVEQIPLSTGDEPSGVIMVMPASPEWRLGGIEGSRQSESRPLDFLDNGSENPPVEPTPLSTGGVILVKPAPPECCLWGIEGSGQSESRPLDFLDNGSENPPVEPTPLSTGGVILVKPAPPECCLWGIEGSGQSESRPLDFLDNGSENPPVEPTPLSTGGVILVKPAPPECCLWGIEGSGQSESRPLDCLENGSENPPVEPTLLAIEDVEQELSATASEDTAPRMKKEKRKRNCFKRFLAWTKRTFCCCITANEDD